MSLILLLWPGACTGVPTRNVREGAPRLAARRAGHSPATRDSARPQSRCRGGACWRAGACGRRC